jgi:hypothetical protein
MDVVDQLQPRVSQPPEKKIWVRPAKLGSRVPLPGGSEIFPDTPVQVPANSVFIARRIRDGSMVQVDGPGDTLASAPASEPAPQQPAPPPPAPEPEPEQPAEPQTY